MKIFNAKLSHIIWVLAVSIIFCMIYGDFDAKWKAQKAEEERNQYFSSSSFNVNVGGHMTYTETK